MASQQLKDQLVKHIDEALAMEQSVLRMLDGMISSTDDEEIRSELRHHKLETEQHAERLEKRLAAHDAWHVSFYPTYAVVDRRGIVRVELR